jgi:hypothetical protein
MELAKVIVLGFGLLVTWYGFYMQWDWKKTFGFTYRGGLPELVSLFGIFVVIVSVIWMVLL